MMKMIVIAKVKKLPYEANQVGTVYCLCNGCGYKIKHKIFMTIKKTFIVCPICKLRWEVTFYDAKGSA